MTHTKAAVPSDARVWALGTLNVLLADNTSTPKPIAVTFKEASHTKKSKYKKGQKTPTPTGSFCQTGTRSGATNLAGQ